ncbi:MAG: NAD-dependent epimerase/dehydratase family protein [Bacteroidia bacterium]|nr:NAD-dependent epimerase/dehydratase family protein [Bacteroidia bacterium]
MILLTGGSGFLGKHILKELLLQGEQVRVMCRHPEAVDWSPFEALGSGKYEVFQGDILDPYAIQEALEGVKQVIHCAALVSFVKKERPLMYRINVEGTANLVDACLLSQVEKFVHISSIAAVGNSQDDSPADEKTRWKKDRQTTHYSITKYQAEKEVYRGIAEGLNAVICNPGVIIGPGADNKTTFKLFARIKKGLKYYPEGTNSYVSVSDCAKAVFLLLKKDLKSGERYILVSEIIPYKDYVGLIAKVVGGKAPATRIPKLLLRIAGPLAEIFSSKSQGPPIISAETSRLVGAKFIFSGQKITRELGFSYTSIEDTLREIAKEFKG